MGTVPFFYGGIGTWFDLSYTMSGIYIEQHVNLIFLCCIFAIQKPAGFPCDHLGTPQEISGAGLIITKQTTLFCNILRRRSHQTNRNGYLFQNTKKRKKQKQKIKRGYLSKEYFKKKMTIIFEEFFIQSVRLALNLFLQY